MGFGESVLMQNSKPNAPSKASVTYEEAAPVIADLFHSLGKRPGGGAVRAYFGRGSNSTFVEYVERFERENAIGVQAQPRADLFQAALAQSATLLQVQHDQDLLVLITENNRLRACIAQLQAELKVVTAAKNKAPSEEINPQTSASTRAEKAEVPTEERPIEAIPQLGPSAPRTPIRATANSAGIAAAAAKTAEIMREDAANNGGDTALKGKPEECRAAALREGGSAANTTTHAHSGAVEAKVVEGSSEPATGRGAPAGAENSNEHENSTAIRTASPPAGQGGQGVTSASAGSMAGSNGKAV